MFIIIISENPYLLVINSIKLLFLNQLTVTIAYVADIKLVESVYLGCGTLVGGAFLIVPSVM